MPTRVHALLNIVLLAAVAALAAEMYTTQRANQRALIAVTHSVERLAASVPSEQVLRAAAADAVARPAVSASVPVTFDVDPATNQVRVTLDRGMQGKVSVRAPSIQFGGYVCKRFSLSVSYPPKIH